MMSVVMMPRDKEIWSDQDRIDGLEWRAEMVAGRRTLKRMAAGICATNIVGFTSVIILILVKP